MSKKFIINQDSIALDPDEIEILIKKIVSNQVEFSIYFENQPINDFWCRYPDEKAEVVYDLMRDISYYSEDKKYIYMHSNIGHYGTYAMDNLLSESDMYRDKDYM